MIAKYRKMHLFDIDIPGAFYGSRNESSSIELGLKPAS